MKCIAATVHDGHTHQCGYEEAHDETTLHYALCAGVVHQWADARERQAAAVLIRGDARALPLPDESVDLIVTSPPYFALRSYTDGGEHYEGQIGSETSPAEYIAALVACTREWVRVLKLSGSIFVNLGDKYATGSSDPGAWSSSSTLGGGRRRPQQTARRVADGSKPKSLMLLPERYRIACVDELGLIARAVIVWSKPNGLPESVTDRVRRAHEDWVHLTKRPRYFSAVDEIRERTHRVGLTWAERKATGARTHAPDNGHMSGGPGMAANPPGKLPGSVWSIATQPLIVPPELGVDHFAAFPTEWPRRLILGWSPPRGVVLDPFGGTGTTALVASVLGRTGMSVDMSADYCRLAAWRTTDPDQRARVLKTARRLEGRSVVTEATDVVMPARTWGDEGKPEPEAPRVLVGSTEAAPVPEVAGALRTVKAAEAAGWTAVQTYAVASVPATARKGAHICHTVCVRMSRTGEDPLTGETVTEHGYALYVRIDKLVGADGVEEGKWSFGDAQFGLKKWGARELASRLAKPPGWAGAGEPTPPLAESLEVTASPAPVDPPPPVPGTWGAVHAGDVIQGMNGRGYRVVSIEQSGQWVGAGVHEVRVVLTPDDPFGGSGGEPIILHRPVTEPAAVAEHADHTEAAAAWDAITQGGMTARVVSEGVTTVDQFSAPGPAPVRREPPRGQWGWYKLPHPVTGEEAIWPRVSTISGALSDETGLTKWKIRQAIKGVAISADLTAAAAALDLNEDKSKLDEIAAQAATRAGDKAGANIGTALDKFTERADAGESIESMGVPENLRGDVEAYARILREHGLTVLTEYTQRTMINCDLEYSGTWDRIVRDRAGNLFKLDLKTNQDLSHSWLEYVMQLAMYAHGTHMCSRDFTTYEPMPPVDKMKGLILHIPARSGQGYLYGVPLNRGWVGAQTAIQARALRTEARKSWSWLVQPENPADVIRLNLDKATTIEELQAIAANAQQRGLWTDGLPAYALARFDLVRVATAGGTDALAALWDELHPAGRWTEAVNAAAAARWEQLQPALAAA